MPEPQWLDRDLIDALHEQSLHMHGGLAGVRDVHVLEAAIASPRNLWAYQGEENLFRLAAHLLVSLAKAHPYSDGNKRIAIISAATALSSRSAPVSLCPRPFGRPDARKRSEPWKRRPSRSGCSFPVATATPHEREPHRIRSAL